MKRLFGVTTAMVTPYDRNGDIDIVAMQKLTEFLIQKNVNCLYPCGTTGEMMLLSPEERETLAEIVVKTANKRVSVFIHAGAMTTKETVRLAQHAEKIGADGIGVVTPSFFSMTEKGILNFYKTVSSAVSKTFPVYVYVIPQCAVNDISPRLMQEIANNCPNIIGVKYSGFDMVKVKDYLRINDETFSVVLGLDRLFVPALTMGCDGVVSGCSCAIPEPFVKIYKLWQENNMKEAMEENKKAAEICEKLGNGSDMSIFKHVLLQRGLPVGPVRPPLLELSAEEWEQRYRYLKEYI
ncbi:dihydrodipicolinate synthase family protein [Treponema sp. HNW]|uniref:dihydrodipicolinate synthase family protein n=1 Tax=Treponema sp. HNW TaxID=3116654 RepID=UPI003D09C6AA